MKKAKNKFLSLLLVTVVSTGSVLPVYSAENTTSTEVSVDFSENYSIRGTGWWSEGNEKTADIILTGDGTVTYSVKSVVDKDNGYSWGNGFVAELYDDNGYYFTTTSFGDAWYYGLPETSTATFTKLDSIENSIVKNVGDVIQVDISRSGDVFTVTYTNKRTNDVYEMTATTGKDEFSDTVRVHISAQYGTFEIIEDIKTYTEGDTRYTYGIVDSKAEIVKYEGTESEVNIPETIDGYKVCGIGESAFEGNTYIEKVVIHDGVGYINSGAFLRCANLKEVQLPASLKTIEAETFNGCSLLQTINLPDSLTAIGESAFYNCTSLVSIEFSDGLQSIGPKAFWGCGALAEINLPSGVMLGKLSFAECQSLTSIVVPAGAVKYVWDDGIFYGCTSLETVVFEKGTSLIGQSMFEGCINLKNVTIPNSV